MRQFLFFLWLMLLLANGNDVISQQPPPSLKWYSIKTPHYRVIFHEGLHATALQTASLMDYVYEKVPGAYEISPKPIPLYLSSLTAVSNGWMALGPRHLHFFAHPMQDASLLGSADWLQLLAVHEFRHTTQFDFLNRNFYQIPAALAGDVGKSLMAMLFIPMWYFEGDAISAETLLTHAGRGRMPSFDMYTKAILTGTNQKFTYNQAYLQSYKRFYPNHYYLGYNLHTHIARNYGIDKWPDIIDRTTRLRRFSGSVKKVTGYNMRKTYKNAMGELREFWSVNQQPIAETLEGIEIPQPKLYTNYKYGHRLNDGSLIYVKNGFDSPPTIVRLVNGQEQKLRGLNNEHFISTNGSILTWSTSTPDIRWELQDFSDVMIMNIETGFTRKLTTGKKYLSPAISPSGEKIASVRYDTNRTYSIDFLSANSGELLYAYSLPYGVYPREPRWSSDGTKLVFHTSDSSGVSINILSENNSLETIPFHHNENILSPLLLGNSLYFVADGTNSNELHVIDLETRERSVALTGGYGYFNPSHLPGSDEVIVESYTPDGHRLYSWEPDPLHFEPYQTNQKTQFYISPLVNMENQEGIFKNYSPETGSYEITEFNHLRQGVKLHSWFFTPAPQGIGATAVASDPLGIHNFAASVEYNQNENTTNQSLSYFWSTAFPVLGLSGSTGRRTAMTSPGNQYYQWNEQSLEASLAVPLNLTREDLNRYLNLSASFAYSFVNGLGYLYKGNYDFGNGSFSSAAIAGSFQVFKAMSLRDIYPRLGFNFDANYRQTLLLSDYSGSLLSIAAESFLPGLMKHHSLRIGGSWEEQNPDFDPDKGYIFPSRALFFRGYDNLFYLQTGKLSIDYSMPLFYPDFGIGSVLYIKRIRTNLFTDFGFGILPGITNQLGSMGIDLIFDVNMFRILAEADLGIRYAQTFDGDSKFEFILLQRFETARTQKRIFR